MPLYFFDINGRRDDIGVDLGSIEAAVQDARRTVLWLAENDRPASEYGDEWTCIIRDEHGSNVHCVTSSASNEGKQTNGWRDEPPR